MRALGWGEPQSNEDEGWHLLAGWSCLLVCFYVKVLESYVLYLVCLYLSWACSKGMQLPFPYSPLKISDSLVFTIGFFYFPSFVFKTIEELEKEMLNGQKLQGPQTSAEVYRILKQKGLLNK